MPGALHPVPEVPDLPVTNVDRSHLATVVVEVVLQVREERLLMRAGTLSAGRKERTAHAADRLKVGVVGRRDAVDHDAASRPPLLEKRRTPLSAGTFHCTSRDRVHAHASVHGLTRHVWCRCAGCTATTPRHLLLLA